MTTDRPVPAIALRQQVPARYLRILHDWAQQIAEYQASIHNWPVSDAALWMRAVINPDWQDGRCEGLTDEAASKGMWAECGRSDAHVGHDQPQEELPQEVFEEIRAAIVDAVAAPAVRLAEEA